ncbi:hypothetical protein B0H13DRAFT_1875412 [Mycena leptocephala]|nr:hypothetical protein B0H13DRAFT_1875412 [Mycena leptocephala]
MASTSDITSTHFKIEPLNGDNWLSYKRQLEALLIDRDLRRVLWVRRLPAFHFLPPRFPPYFAIVLCCEFFGAFGGSSDALDVAVTFCSFRGVEQRKSYVLGAGPFGQWGLMGAYCQNEDTDLFQLTKDQLNLNEGCCHHLIEAVVLLDFCAMAHSLIRHGGWVSRIPGWSRWKWNIHSSKVGEKLNPNTKREKDKTKIIGVRPLYLIFLESHLESNRVKMNPPRSQCMGCGITDPDEVKGRTLNLRHGGKSKATLKLSIERRQCFKIGVI